MGVGHHGKQRLPDMLDGVGREDGVILDDAAIVVFPGDVLGGENGDDACSPAHRLQVDGTYPPMRHDALPERHVQGPRRQRDVIRVMGLAGDVKDGAVVRKLTAATAFVAVRRTGLRIRLGGEIHGVAPLCRTICEAWAATCPIRTARCAEDSSQKRMRRFAAVTLR